MPKLTARDLFVATFMQQHMQPCLLFLIRWMHVFVERLTGINHLKNSCRVMVRHHPLSLTKNQAAMLITLGAPLVLLGTQPWSVACEKQMPNTSFTWGCMPWTLYSKILSRQHGAHSGSKSQCLHYLSLLQAHRTKWVNRKTGTYTLIPTLDPRTWMCSRSTAVDLRSIQKRADTEWGRAELRNTAWACRMPSLSPGICFCHYCQGLLW